MKRFLSIVGVTIAVLSATMPSSVAAADDPRVIGRVTQLVGEAEVERAGAGGIETLGRGSDVFTGDEVTTGREARLKVVLLDGTVLMLGENTLMTISEEFLAGDAPQSRTMISLPLGFLRAVIGRLFPGNAAEVVTGTAITAVRSTDWIVEAQPETTAVVALDGRVAVTSDDPSVGGRVVLGPGEGTDVRRGEPPGPKKTWGRPRVVRAIAATAFP